METTVGVFSSRARAEEAVRELLAHLVPEESIVFLTRSEPEPRVHSTQPAAAVGGILGGATGMSAGVAAATLMLTGVGAVFALGIGAAALLGLAGAGAGAAVGKAMTQSSSLQPTPDERAGDDVSFFHDVLREGRSLIVVRTESRQIAASACSVLNRLGIGIEGKTPVKMRTSTRQDGDVTLVDVSGRITLGEGNAMLREIVRALVAAGRKKIALNLHEVGYVDSSGVGELVKAYTTVHNCGGELRLVNPSQRLHDLLEMTRLSSVFPIDPDEASALRSFAGEKNPNDAVA